MIDSMVFVGFIEASCLAYGVRFLSCVASVWCLLVSISGGFDAVEAQPVSRGKRAVLNT